MLQLIRDLSFTLLRQRGSHKISEEISEEIPKNQYIKTLAYLELGKCLLTCYKVLDVTIIINT